jgi:hypothetical protein
MSPMQVGTSFRLGGDDARQKRLEAAQELAAKLSTVECPWHNKTAEVRVALGDDKELHWAIKGGCCDDFKAELAKIIDQASS